MMIPRTGIARLLILLLPVILGACSSTKNLSDKEYLLVGNRFTTDNKKISSDDLEGYLQQLPNNKLFGMFRTNIHFYNMGSKGKDSKFKKWLRTKVGDAPVILDTSLLSISRKQMKLFLNNKGYFQSVVTDSVAYRKKKATVHFDIRAGQPYTYRSIQYLIPDTQIASFVLRDTSESLIKKGNNYDAYLLDEERTRISNDLLNQGFYYFNPSYIVFRLDSNLNSHRMDLLMEITNPVVPSFEGFGMVAQVPHKRFYINNVYIYPEFDKMNSDTATWDTLVATYDKPGKNRGTTTYHFLSSGKFRLKPRTMAQTILFEPGDEYTLKDVTKTYSQLNGLQVFKIVNISFDEKLAPADSPHPDLLDCKIKLARSSGNAISVSTDATNSAGAFGMSGAVGYQNKNLFTGAQLLKISLSATAQMQAGGGSSALFNTMEFGANATLTFPQFLIPMKPERFNKESRPKTVITLGYNFQSKLDPKYIRNMVNASFGYTWVQNDKLSHVMNPVELLFVKVNQSPEFQAELDTLQDQRLKNQYTSHVVAGLRYTLTFSNQQQRKGRNFLYIRGNFETGGNLLYGINKVLGSDTNSGGSYTLLGIPYSQYVRPDIDLRYYWMLKKNHSVVNRFYGGIAIPYLNTDAVPFEKAFLAGGANDLRGWKLGYLGPGTFKDTTGSYYSQIGDIQLQLNLEYRFPIAGFLKGALFADLGNIWILKESPDLPGGKFNWNTFYKQIGIDMGIGIRLDFDFFIFRLDPAIVFRQPSYPEQGGWYFSKWQLKDIIWNFGIGYPF